jgi:opacity protein-like surface antigen
VAILAAAAAPAAAQDRPFYVEPNIGRTSIDDLGGARINESATAYRLGTGYRFLPWLGAAGAFVNLGTVNSSVDVGSGTPLAVEASADGFEVVLTGQLPLTDALALTAQAGFLWWKGDTSIDGLASSDSGNDFTWGVGAEYAFTPTLAATTSWRRYSIDNVDADTIWLGILVRFGDAP